MGQINSSSTSPVKKSGIKKGNNESIRVTNKDN